MGEIDPFEHPPLYEAFQVLTCGEMESIAAQLVAYIDAIPKWKWIERWKYKIALQTVDDLHIAMHKKEEKMKEMRKMEDTDE